MDCTSACHGHRQVGFFQSFRHFQSRQSHEASDIFSQMGVAEDLAWSLEVSLGSKASPVMRFPVIKGLNGLMIWSWEAWNQGMRLSCACSVHFFVMDSFIRRKLD